MTRAPKQSQHERFIEAARELETDDSPEEFERVFGKVVPPKKAGDIAPERAKPTPREKRPYRRRR